MKKKPPRFVPLTAAATVLGALFLSGPRAADARTGTDLGFINTDLGGLLSPNLNTQAFAINDSGQVAGFSQVSTGATEAFVWRDGVMTSLGKINPALTNDINNSGGAYAINNNGAVAGEGLAEGAFVHHAFSWSEPLPGGAGGGMKDLGTLGYRDSQAYGINDAGQVVGFSYGQGQAAALLWQAGGQIVSLGTLGGSFNYSVAHDINNQGQVVGFSKTATGTTSSDHAFLWKAGKMIDLGTLPGGTYSVAHAINDQGQVVGEADTTGGRRHAFLWKDKNGNGASDAGEMIDLDALSSADSAAYGINEVGRIVGVAEGATGERHATLWLNATLHLVGVPVAMHDLNTVAGIVGQSEARGINVRGQIVGSRIVTGAYREVRAFLLTPKTTTVASVDVGTLGQNNWYTSPEVRVTLTATEPEVVRAVYYKVDGGDQQTYLGGHIVINGDGKHTLEFWSVDVVGNEETHGTQNVWIDATLPALTVPAGKTVNVEPGATSAIVDPGAATATDAMSGLAGEVSGTRSDGKPLADRYQIGKTTITWAATDNAGNTAQAPQIIEVVTVGDTEAPVLSGGPLSDVLVYVPYGQSGAVVSFQEQIDQLTAIDNVDPNPSIVASPASGSVFRLGKTTVSVTAVDTSGNTSAPLTFVVTVGSAQDRVALLLAAIRSSTPLNQNAPDYIEYSFRRFLINRVNAALLVLNLGWTRSAEFAAEILRSVIQAVEKNTPKKIHPTKANELTNLASQILHDDLGY